jgi:hypothetical protein
VIAGSLRSSSPPKVFHLDNQLLVQDFLWGWLNGKLVGYLSNVIRSSLSLVNTRCLYYQLDPSPSAPDNLTLCPVLDFANHAPSNTHIVPVLPSSIFAHTHGHSKTPRKVLGGEYMFLSSSETPIRKDDELFLRYGGHANRTLFIEYGFVKLWKEGDCRNGSFSGEVDVQNIVEELFSSKGSIGQSMKKLLEEVGYWGYNCILVYIPMQSLIAPFTLVWTNSDWTMHSQPAPAHPSYRLISALRLLHCIDSSIEPEGSALEDVFEQWRRVLYGQEEALSEACEKAWRQTLSDICERVAQRAQAAIQSVGAQSESLWAAWMQVNVETLWREELEVAEAVRSSVQAGIEF